MSKPKISFSSKIFFTFLSLLVLFVSSIVVWNTIRLQQEFDHRTRRYVSDVSDQLAKDIDNRLAKVTVDLESICDSLLQIDTDAPLALDEFLLRKSQILGFSSIVILENDGSIYQSNSSIQDISSLLGIQESFQGKNGVSFLDKQSILYSVPIYEEGEIVGVLGGLRDKENMQNLVQTESFSGKGLNCIIDQNGEVVISPTDVSPFMELDHLFTANPHGEVAQEIYKMKDKS